MFWRWLTTSLDWIAAGCPVTNLLVLLVLLVAIMPAAKQSNVTLKEMNLILHETHQLVVAGDLQRIKNFEAIKAIDKGGHVE